VQITKPILLASFALLALALDAIASDPKLESLIDKLSLDEKVAQLSGERLNSLVSNGALSLEKCEKLIPHGIGHVSQFSSCLNLPPDRLAAVVADLQR